jgi:hypothetical protein
LDARSWERRTVEEITFSGSTERLRLRLPRIPGVRPIAPAVPFGSDNIFVDASRPQDHAVRFPLKPGDPAWIALRRIHALPDLGLSILLLADAAPESLAAMDFAGKLAQISNARLCVLSSQEEDGPLGDGNEESTRHDERIRQCVGVAPLFRFTVGLSTGRIVAPALRSSGPRNAAARCLW